MSDNKTIKDAVRLYQGSFPDGACGCYGGWELELEKLFYNSLFICTRQEFEDYAKKMKETTKQKEIENAYKYFLRENTADLPFMYLNIIYNTFEGRFCARLEGCVSGDDQLVCTREEFEAYAQEQEKSNKPVFTQEMADNGELPPIGSSVVLRYNFDSKTVTHTGIVLFSSACNCILATEHGESHFKMGDYIYEAIDTRTDEEKLIDEMENLITEHCSSNGTLRDLPRTFLEYYDITPK